MMSKEVIKIEIPTDLLKLLREYCDRAGIAFLDFVEDALETATYRDELDRLVNEGSKMKQRIESERAMSLKHGFSLGVMAATLALNGSLNLCESVTPKEAREVLLFQPVLGEQLKLF